jgi:hypothetical protein
MTRPVDVYREMLQKDVSGPRPATTEETLATLDLYWTKTSDQHDANEWPIGQRIPRRIWAGLGLMAFGRLGHLEETLKIIQAYPGAASSKTCRYYLSAIQNLLPLPDRLSPVKHIHDVLRWWRSISDRLVWSEEEGRFIETPDKVGPVTTLASETGGRLDSHVSDRLPFVLLDYRVWATPRAAEDVFNHCLTEHLGILIPDVALHQLGKSRLSYDDRRTLLHSIAKYRTIVSLAKEVGEMMRAEVPFGQPTRNVVNEEVTQSFRRILGTVDAGQVNGANTFLTQLSDEVRAETLKREHHEKNRNVIKQLQRQWQKALPSDDLAQLRLEDEAVFVRVMAEWETAAIVFQAAKRDGCNDEAAMRLALEPSVYGHLVYGLAALALDSLAADNSGAPWSLQERNDLLDLDYLCIALFCRDLTTTSKRLQRVWSRLVKAFSVRAEVVRAILQVEAHAPERQPTRINRVRLSQLRKKMRRERIRVSV